MNNETGRNERADLRSTFYVYLAQAVLPDPEQVFQEALGAMNGYMDMDALFGAALPLFHRLGKPLPKIPVIVGMLNDPGISEEYAEYILRVLVDTGSAETYRDEMSSLVERFPNLRSVV
ncbi:MAG: hypothetical protein WC651_01575 [Candidatus Gracilibacteria bacterium]|jgi:hypothetical protein